ncbi:hypothetical protein ANCCEY_02892 [Ancylostoma ceylanicum]|uniref:Uncharacterized protein n=1 Tax=Ancylostoma ceylanicum TaxID=53326 RepID=A0A0D6M3H8_9BILA|nr:hypothetical protein ANCCEY_02892 [Ancylostoma ceylanicum]
MKRLDCPTITSDMATISLSSRDRNSNAGFTHLGGATQFAIIQRKFNEFHVPLPHASLKPYKKAGEAVAKNSLFSLEREKLKQAFILWLERNPLREEDLLRTYVGNYWRVYMSSVVDLIELPKQLRKNMNSKALVDMLRFLCNGRVIYETHDGEPCLNIPHNVTKDELIELMTSKN